MKLNVNHTLELTDEQTVINGEKRLGRELKKLFIRALEDLARGERVALIDYDLDEKLEELLHKPEARERAARILAGYQMADYGSSMIFPAVPPSAGDAGDEQHRGDDDEADNVLAGDDDETAEIPTVRTCLRCEQEASPEEPGMCEDCKGFIHTKCRAEDLGELIEERGPMPAELRGVDPQTGAVGDPPYLCGRCTVARLETILAGEEGSPDAGA